MIDRAELRRRASGLDLREEHIERDYVLCHVLSHVPHFVPELVFRGGTALARIYWPDYRLSEDLDFICDEGVVSLEERLREAIIASAKSTGLEISFVWGPYRSGWSRSKAVWGGGEILIDVLMGGELGLPADDGRLVLPYADLSDEEVIRVAQRADILGNKWFMLSDREEPRDLFDIWAGLCLFDVPFDELAQGHVARYGYPPVANFIEVAARLENAWEARLAHQVSDLPTFSEVRREVKSKLRDWREEISSTSR